VRSEILKILDNKDVSDMEDACRFFRLYNKNADEALKSIDLTKVEIMKNIHV